MVLKAKRNVVIAVILAVLFVSVSVYVTVNRENIKSYLAWNDLRRNIPQTITLKNLKGSIWTVENDNFFHSNDYLQNFTNEEFHPCTPVFDVKVILKDGTELPFHYFGGTSFEVVYNGRDFMISSNEFYQKIRETDPDKL